MRVKKSEHEKLVLFGEYLEYLSISCDKERDFHAIITVEEFTMWDMLRIGITSCLIERNALVCIPREPHMIYL